MASANARPRRRAKYSESGTSALEYGAVILLVAAIFAAPALVLVPAQVDASVSSALCRLFSLAGDPAECADDGTAGGPDVGPSPNPSPTASDDPGSGDGRPETDEDKQFKPKLCEKLYKKEWWKREFTAMFIKLSDEFAFIRQEYSDGTVRLTALSSVHVGVEVEHDFNVFKSGGKKLGGKIGGGLNMSVGDTFVFPNEAEANKKISDLKSYIRDKRDSQANARSLGCLKNPSAQSCKVPDAPELEPEITTKSLGGQGSLGLNFGKLNKDGKKGDNSGGRSFSANLLGGQGKIAGETIEEFDNRDPDNPLTSRIYSFTVEGEGSGGLIHGKGMRNVALKITRDKDGKLVRVIMSEATEDPKGEGFNIDASGQAGPFRGGYSKTEREGRYHTRTAFLNVTDDNRELIERWLEGKNSGAGDLADEVGAPVEIGDDSSDWDRVKQEFYDHGKVSKVLYDTEFKSEKAGWGLSFFGLDFSVAIEWGNESRESIDAAYLGAPDGENPRDWLDFPECVHKDE